VYLLSRRAFQLSEMAVFDQPVVATNCPERSRTAVPLQSLTMLNGRFVWDQSEALAARLPAASRDEQVAGAFQRAVARRPSPVEAERSSALLDRQTALYAEQGLAPHEAARKALVHLCHTLLNTSEFLYAP
jgi:hypothetical protein